MEGIYFEGIGDDLGIIAKEINGPSWSLKKKIDIDEIQKRIEQRREKIYQRRKSTN